MLPDDELIAVARAITERLPVDWAATESSAADDSIRASMRELKVIAEIAALHSSTARSSSTRSTVPSSEPPQDAWGPLVLLEHVARGSFGDVYRALDTRLDREVALKLLRGHDASADPIGSAVIEEARLLARVHHPNIVTIYGADRVDGRVGLWMEFVRGRTLEQVLQDRGPLATADVAAIGVDICRALAAVHSVGLLHRDIKAHNVMRQNDGRLVLMDFGAGCDVADDSADDLAGTPLYLAPEILDGRPATPQADVYSVGVLLYRLLTGSYPVTGRTIREIRECHRAGRRAALCDSRADVPDRLSRVIDRALEVDAGDRFSSADEMAETLAATTEPPERHFWRAPVVVPALIAALGLAGVGAAVRWITGPIEEPSTVMRASSAPPLGRATDVQSLAASQSKQTRQIWTGEGVDQNGTPSPDGRYLSFTDWDTGDLAVRDLVTGTNRRLTNTGGWVVSGDYASESVMAPDGGRIAYAWFVEKEFKNELRLASIATGEPFRPKVVLRTERNEFLTPFAWTPDGRQLLVLRSLQDRTNQNRTNQIGTVTIQDGSFRTIKSLEWRDPDRLSLSPDGRHIAYDVPAGESGSPRDIFVLAIDGSRETAVVQSPANDSAPLWSPDGSRLVFLSDRTGNNSLWTVPIENGRPNGSPVLVKPNVGPMVLLGMTTSGTLYYFVGAVRALYVADLDAMLATKPPVLANEQFIDGNVGPAWSRDGRYLAYYSLRNPAVLVIRSTKTGEERTVPLPTRVAWPFAAGPKWFPDNRSVLVLSRDARGSGFGFYRLTLDTGNTELLAHLPRDVSSFDLSPDGRTIFYIFQNPLAGRLMRFDIDSHRETELKKNEWFISLAVSPDGMQLAYLKSVRVSANNPSAAPPVTAPSVVEVMPAAGGPSREVFSATPWLSGARYNALAWSPDQRFLLFVQDDWAIWKVPALGSDAEKVGISMRGIKSPAVHPDSKRIIFSAFAPDKSEVWALENFLPAVSATNIRPSAALTFRARDWVLIAAFENRTGEAVLDGTLESALDRELANSAFVNVAPRERIEDILSLMRKPTDTKVDARIGREIAIRDGAIRALIAGRVERIGPAYAMTAQIVNPTDGVVMASVSEEASTQSDLLQTVRRLGLRMREGLGEMLSTVRESELALEKVTTPSLHAAQLYSRAAGFMRNDGTWEIGPAEELLKQAVQEDPDFASAHILLAWATQWQGRAKDEYLPHATRALALVDRTSDVERYFIIGGYHLLLARSLGEVGVAEGDQHRRLAVPAYEALLKIKPDHYWGVGLLSNVYNQLRQEPEATAMRVRQADLRPTNLSLRWSLAQRFFARGDRAGGWRHLRKAEALITPEFADKHPEYGVQIQQLQVGEAWLRHDVKRVRELTDALARRIDVLDGTDPAVRGIKLNLVGIYNALGRLGDARRAAEHAPVDYRHEYIGRVLFTAANLGKPGGTEALLEHLTTLYPNLGTIPATPLWSASLALIGRIDDLRTAVERARRDGFVRYYGNPIRWFVSVAEARLTLAEGRVEESMRLFQVAAESGGPTAAEGAGAVVLIADAWVARDDRERAIAILEHATRERWSSSAVASNFAGFGAAVNAWMGARDRLGDLYRATGRFKEARAIDADLMRLLAVADADHPVVKRIKARQAIS